jgi:hypothetical protein
LLLIHLLPFLFFSFSGVYGTKGTGTISTIPGGRHGARSWIDVNGTFWLFGGDGYGSSSTGECFRFFSFC